MEKSTELAMSRYLCIFFIVFIANLAVVFPAFAQTVVFTPTSPQTYDGTSDENISLSGYTGSIQACAFNVDGSLRTCDNANSSHLWNGYWDSTSFQARQGSAGTMHFLNVDTSIGDAALCTAGTYTTCTGAAAWTGDSFPFCLDTGGSCSGGGGGGGGTSSSTADTYSQRQWNLFLSFVIFFTCFLGVVWLLRKH